uniref:Uncharacterized protein n=1 Tax=Sphaerodactylus townsendi TaxID=933632 RepID=A0ACB8EUZ7_9SAUR
MICISSEAEKAANYFHGGNKERKKREKEKKDANGGRCFKRSCNLGFQKCCLVEVCKEGFSSLLIMWVGRSEAMGLWHLFRKLLCFYFCMGVWGVAGVGEKLEP